MRAPSKILVALAVGSMTTGAALAGEATSPQGQIQTFEVSHEPAVKSTSANSTAGSKVRIVMTLRRADGAPASGLGGLRLYFPRGLTINRARFPKCDLQKVWARGTRACPKGSRVGTGSLSADARPVLGEVTGKVSVYNASDRRLLLYVTPTVSAPLAISLRLHDESQGRFGGWLSWSFCCTLLGPDIAPFTRADITIGATLKKVRGSGSKRRVRKIPYLVNPPRCVESAFHWQMFFSYANGEELTIADAVPCKT